MSTLWLFRVQNKICPEGRGSPGSVTVLVPHRLRRITRPWHQGPDGEAEAQRGMKLTQSPGHQDLSHWNGVWGDWDP